MVKRSIPKPRRGVGSRAAPEVARREPGREEAPRRTAPGRSDLARLVAEVERLEGELTAARAHLAQMEVHADIDPLTAVFNRRGFERELARAIAYLKRYGGSAALVYVDLDRFKPVNDRHGHAAGDAVLKAVAALLVRNVRASDTVARLGGDELGLILWNLGEADAQAKARRLEAMIAGTAIAWGSASLSVGASAGVAMLDPAATSADAIATADRAMYARKAVRSTS